MPKQDRIVAGNTVLLELKALLTDHFGPAVDGAWRIVNVGCGICQIQVKAGDIFVRPGDVVHIKRTSILVDKVS